MYDVIDEVAGGAALFVVVILVGSVIVICYGIAFLCFSAVRASSERQKSLPPEDPWAASFGVDLGSWDGVLHLKEAIGWD